MGIIFGIAAVRICDLVAKRKAENKEMKAGE